MRAAKAKKDSHPIWKLRVNRPIIFSHDNASFFTAARLPEEGLGEVWRIEELPSKSPDLHKIVEHPIHAIKATFRREFTQLSVRLSSRRAATLLEECIQESVTQERIFSDMLTYKQTLLSVIRNGGDWAEPPYR